MEVSYSLVVFGEFRFKRRSNDCFGLNVYGGEKRSHQVISSPRMSKETTFHSQLYRDCWDPTFLPLILKLQHKLVSFSTVYQTNTDKILDLFMAEWFRRVEQKQKIEPVKK